MDGGDHGYDDDGAVVPTVGPDWSRILADLDGEEIADVAGRLEAVNRLFHRLLAGKPRAIEAGRRLYLLAHYAGHSPCATQRELAKRLGLTIGRVSQRLKAIKLDPAGAVGEKRNQVAAQIKLRAHR